MSLWVVSKEKFDIVRRKIVDLEIYFYGKRRF